MRAKATRVPHAYQAGDMVLVKRGSSANKHETPNKGPCEILDVCDNGTIRLKMDSIVDTCNIRNIIPYVDANRTCHGEDATCGFLRREEDTELQSHRDED